MTTTSKTIGTFIATAVVGLFTVLLGNPKKVLQNKINAIKSREQVGAEEKENLFI